MFTTSHPRRSSRTQLGRRIGAGVTALVLSTGFALAGTGAANAATSQVSFAQAKFLGGSLLGTNLDNVVSLQAATAVNTGGSTATQKDPLQADVLNTVQVGNGPSVQANLGQVVQLGAISQYATAAKNGTSMAFTGAVSPDGAIGIGKDVALPGGDATVDLSKLLGAGFASNIANLKVAISAAAAQAIASGKTASGKYNLADVTLNFTSPAISDLTQKVDSALASVQTNVSKLGSKSGVLVGDLNKQLIAIDPTLSLLGADAHVTVSLQNANLSKLVADLLKAQYGASGISFNLETGIVTLDLEKLLGKDLNSLAPGTQLISSKIIDPILDSVTTKVSTIADQVVDRVKAALHNAKLTIHADLSQDVAQPSVTNQVCNTIQKVIQVPTQVVQQISVQVPVINGTPLPLVNGVPQLNGLPVVGSLVGKVQGTLTYVTQIVNQTVTELVNKTVDQVVCTNNVTAVPPLNTSATVDLSGTVDDYIKGAGVTATANVKLLGVATKLNLNLAIGGIGSTLNGQLFGSDGAITKLVKALDSTLVNPAVQGLTDGNNSAGLALSSLLSITANNQSTSNGMFTETALVVKVLASAGSSAAQLNVAAASVGPNKTQGDSVGGVSTNPPTNGSDGNNPTVASVSRLATTGAGIAALVAAVLALLAAGAYMVRESYRRKHSALAG